MKTNIIQLGGLGNQMFIYALYYTLKRRGIDVRIDASLYNFVKMHNGYELPTVFGLENPEICAKGIHIQWLRLLLHYKPKLFVYDEPQERSLKVFDIRKPYISGYWQSDFYFDMMRNEIIDLYQFKSISSRNKIISREMQNANSVSLHIRRGDYLKIPGATDICSEEYYRKAIKLICERVCSPHFYIFSNDTKWSKEFAESLDIPYTLIDHNTGKDSYQDMYLMTQCKHNILANSSFSWWGAYLNTNKDSMRIAPLNWCPGHSVSTLESDTPKDWIRI